MSLILQLPEQINFIKSALQTHYADVLEVHSGLNVQIDTHLRDWKHEAHLFLLRENPFDSFEQDWLEQEQLFQQNKSVFNQEYIGKYKSFCKNNGLPFDGHFWFNELNGKKTNKSKKQSNKISWRVMLDQWRKQLDQCKAEWYLQQLQELREKRLNELKAWLEFIRQLSRLLDELGLDTGFWIDNSLGELTLQNVEELKRWLNYLANDEGAKQIAELLGKMRQIEQSERIESVQKTIFVSTPIIDVNSREEIIGLRLDKELEYVLPSELALMSDETTDILFDLKYLETKLMCFELQGRNYCDESMEITDIKQVSENEKLGPMIVCVDTSGSMQGIPEHIAKAMALFLGTKAKSEKRSCFIINFSVEIESFEINEQSGIAELIAFLRKSFHGGTDVAPALRYALELIKQEKYEKADVLLISDFIMNSLPSDILDAIQVQRELKTKFNSLVIGNTFMDQRLNTHFDYEWIYNPHSKNIQKLVQFQKEILQAV